jgi:hypothetical protein
MTGAVAADDAVFVLNVPTGVSRVDRFSEDALAVILVNDLDPDIRIIEPLIERVPEDLKCRAYVYR